MRPIDFSCIEKGERYAVTQLSAVKGVEVREILVHASCRSISCIEKVEVECYARAWVDTWMYLKEGGKEESKSAWKGSNYAKLVQEKVYLY